MSILRVLSGLSLIAAGVRAINESTRRPASLDGDGAFASGAGMKASIHGVRDLDDRMRIIVKLIQQGKVDPSVRAWVSEVLTRRCGDSWCVPEKDRSAEIRAIFDAIRERVRYTGDVWSTDTYQAARHVLAHKTADCDDFTILGASCLLAVGIPVTLVVIQTTQSGARGRSHCDARPRRVAHAPRGLVRLNGRVAHHDGCGVQHADREPRRG